MLQYFSDSWRANRECHSSKLHQPSGNDLLYLALVVVAVVFSVVEFGFSIAHFFILSVLNVILIFHASIKKAFIYNLVFLLSLAWAFIHIKEMQNRRLPIFLEGKVSNWVGEVRALSERTLNDGRVLQRFEFHLDCTRSEYPCAWPMQRLRLSHYLDSANTGLMLQNGQKRWLSLRLKRPHGPYNPQGWSLDRFSAGNGIDAVGTVKALGDVLAPPRWPWLIRQTIETPLLEASWTSFTSLAIFTALITGDRAVLSDDHRLVLQRTGTDHLLSVSGLHVALVAGAFGIMGGWLLFALLGFKVSRQTCMVSVGLVSAYLYGAFLHWPVAVTRAVLMVFMAAALIFFGVGRSAWHRWVMVLTAMAVADPLSLLLPGFWLSFLAVAILIALAPSIRHLGWWHQAWKSQVKLTFGLFPLLVLLGMPVTPFAVIVNLVAVPVVGLWVLPVGMMSLALISAGMTFELLYIVLWPLEWVWRGMSWAAQEWHVVNFYSSRPFLCCLALMVCIGWSMLPWGRLGLLAFAVALMPARSTVEQGEFELQVWDVGQGSSLSVRTQHHHVMVDVGNGDDEWTAAEQWVLPTLRSQGVNHVDRLIITHGDADHAGGLQRILSSFPVHMVVSNDVTADRACRAGDQWVWDGVSFRIVWPVSGFSGSSNDGSCVLHITNGVRSVLVMGDVSKRIEEKLVADGVIEPSTVLIAGHHGSRTSSSVALLNKVNAEYAVFSVGYRNAFGHPRPEIEERFVRRDATIVRTDQTGYWRFRSKTNEVLSWRHQSRPWLVRD